jgi:hypothetical protein
VILRKEFEDHSPPKIKEELASAVDDKDDDDSELPSPNSLAAYKTDLAELEELDSLFSDDE